jgi:hypothetical protein
MAYKVIKYFTDLQDDNFAYEVGDVFPRDGFGVLPSRIKELAGKENRRGEPLIEEVQEKEEEPKKRTRTVKKTEE